MNDEVKLGKIGQRARKVPSYIRISLIFIAVGLTVYWIVTFSGPYAWAAIVQAKVLGGEHYIFLSGLIAFLAPTVPAALIIQFLAGFIKSDKYSRESTDIIEN